MGGGREVRQAVCGGRQDAIFAAYNATRVRNGSCTVSTEHAAMHLSGLVKRMIYGHKSRTAVARMLARLYSCTYLDWY